MRVLFVARAGDRHGDGQVLLTFLRWLEDDDIEPVVVVGRDGPLVADFQRVAETHVLFPVRAVATPRSSLRRAYNGVLRARMEADRRRFRARLGHFDLVYVNGLAGATPIVDRLGITDEAPILIHLHEQAFALREFEHVSGGASRFVPRTDRFIAVSPTGAAALRDEYDVPESAISIVFPFVDIDQLAAQRSSVGLRELAGLPDDTFVVGGAGRASWRKGSDVFVQVAREMTRRHAHSDVAFVWLGHVGNTLRDQLEQDITALGLGTVHFVGEHANAPALFREFDVLCVPSREDPFACAILECAAGGVPSVRFRAADKRAVFGENGGAIVVDYLDVPAMAQAIADLVDDPPRLRELGAQAQECVQEFDVHVLGPQIVELIKQTARRRIRAI